MSTERLTITKMALDITLAGMMHDGYWPPPLSDYKDGSEFDAFSQSVWRRLGVQSPVTDAYLAKKET